MNILFITSTRIGDVVLSTGILDHLSQSYPDARITIACGPEAAPLFEARPGNWRVIPLEKKPYKLHWLGLWSKCIGQHWSLVVDLRSTAISWCLLARHRHVVRSSPELKHRVRQLSELLGLDPPAAPRLWTSPDHDARAAELIPGTAPVLALGPTANWWAKQWPGENFNELARRLTAPGGILAGARIAVFGGPGERDAAALVIAAALGGDGIDLVGKCDLPTVFACLKRCNFFVGNDSGLMHLAAASGILTLGLFGPSRVEHYAPWGEHAAAVQTATPYEDLFPLGYDNNATGTLMGSLSVDKAEIAAGELWRRRGGNGS